MLALRVAWTLMPIQELRATARDLREPGNLTTRTAKGCPIEQQAFDERVFRAVILGSPVRIL
jgi:hypothetical protein